jgi:hypothetical protein
MAERKPYLLHTLVGAIATGLFMPAPDDANDAR